MKRYLGMTLMFVAVCSFAMAQATTPLPGGAPELDPGSMGSALALLTGATLVVRGRRKK